ncbi:MAG: nickel pincer cofactor biosynthesis protein LarB [Candidatus Lokiarchaeota archaeon]|nr:nickel pincer cofactor biosynthesis protein LarB [Candidatus Lokiarchaeota archaeon]
MSEGRRILQDLLEGKISLDEAENLLKATRIENIDNIVKLDVGRELRTGVPEIIYAEGKDPEVAVETAIKMAKLKKYAILTRSKNVKEESIKKHLPPNFKYSSFSNGGLYIIQEKDHQFPKTGGKIGIITAGTSDIPIAEEARIVAEAMGVEVLKSYDVGIAGFHRIFPPLQEMIKANVDTIIVIAGFEGTLPGVVASLVDIPVIGVPTSIGYGVGMKGFSAMIAMLASCAPGLAVVNIDNGFGAAILASQIANRMASCKEKKRNKTHE